LNGDNDRTLLLVFGDFSGIQDTVYTISSKGALKSLRARSFMLELLTEHIVYEILQLAGIKTDKPENYLIQRGAEHGVIYSGGGAFSLLLKNEDGLKTEIDDFTDILNFWAMNEFSGKLFIAIHVLSVSETEIKDSFPEKRQEQADELEKLKQRKFRTENGALLRKLLTPKMPVQTDIEKECQITRRDDLPDKEADWWPNNEMEKEPSNNMWMSLLSFHLWHLGDNLTGLGDNLTGLKEEKNIWRYDYSQVDKKGRRGFLCFPKAGDGLKYALYTTEDEKTVNLKSEKSWKIGDDFFYAHYVRKVGDLPKYAQDRELEVIQEDEPEKSLKDKDIRSRTASFAGLAACSCGADMIGSLRMDVDNLGKLFSEIGSHKSSCKKPYKELANRSHQLNYFFKVILNQICEGDFYKIRSSSEENAAVLFDTDALKSEKLPTRLAEDIDETKKRNVSIIYAGGDDLFIIGAWNEVAELAFDIQKCFHQYCEANDIKNEDGTASISGGLTLHHPKFPLYQMAARSKEAEHEAKTCREKDDTEAQKNRIALFHDPVKVQRHSQLKQKRNGREFRYMLSMSWKTGNRFLLRLMREFVKLGEFIPGEENKRSLFVMDKISHQSIEKCFMITEKFQQSGERYMPTMARLMADTCKSLRGMGQQELFVKLMAYLYRKDSRNMPHLHIALNWISFLRRTR